MKILIAVSLFLIFPTVTKASTISSTPKLSKDIIEEICESIRFNDFPIVLIIAEEEGFRLENVFGEIYCRASIPSILHFALDEPSKYGLTTFNILGYFDQVKKENSQFDYGRQVLNIPYELHDGSTDTLLSRSLRGFSMRLSHNSSNIGSIARLMTIIDAFIKRGAQTAKQLGTTEKLDLLLTYTRPVGQKRYKNKKFTSPCKDQFSPEEKPEQYVGNKKDAYFFRHIIEQNNLKAVKNALTWCAIDINDSRSLEDNTPPLTIAVLNGHVDIVKLLLARSEIEVNRPTDNYNGYTALDIAYLYNKKNIVPLLLNKQAKCSHFCDFFDSEKYYELGESVN